VSSLRTDEKVQSSDIAIKAMKPTEDTFNLVYVDGKKRSQRKKQLAEKKNRRMKW
jgi:hypothetical protein